MRWKNRLHDFESDGFPKMRLRAILAGGLLALGICGFNRVGPVRMGFTGTKSPTKYGQRIGAHFPNQYGSALGWFYARLILEAIVGLMLFGAAILLVGGRQFQGIQLSIIGLLLSLTAVNLLVFYFDQFSTIILATIQFLLLLGVIHYRKRYLLTV